MGKDGSGVTDGGERQHESESENGNAAQVEAWARALGPRLFRSALYLTGDPQEAEELCQETFAIAVEGGFRGASAPYTWLYGIMRNVLRAWRKKRRPATAADLPESGRGRLPVEASPPARAEAAEAAARVREAVLALPEDQRDIVLLRYMEDASLGEIAAAIGIPEGTVKSRLFAARARLRSALGGTGWAERDDGAEVRVAG